MLFFMNTRTLSPSSQDAYGSVGSIMTLRSSSETPHMPLAWHEEHAEDAIISTEVNSGVISTILPSWAISSLLFIVNQYFFCPESDEKGCFSPS